MTDSRKIEIFPQDFKAATEKFRNFTRGLPESERAALAMVMQRAGGHTSTDVVGYDGYDPYSSTVSEFTSNYSLFGQTGDNFIIIVGGYN